MVNERKNYVESKTLVWLVYERRNSLKKRQMVMHCVEHDSQKKYTLILEHF